MLGGKNNITMKLIRSKCGVGPIGAVLLFMFFLIIWFVWLSSWVNTVGENAVTTNHLTGVEAFFFANLNFVILICMVLGMLGWLYFGGGG